MKHAQCFDKALMKDGSIVFASKDYRLYIYRYVKVNWVISVYTTLHYSKSGNKLKHLGAWGGCCLSSFIVAA